MGLLGILAGANLFLASALSEPQVSTGAAPPGKAPFAEIILPQPVPGAARAFSKDGWKKGKLCDVSAPPYSVKTGTNATAALQKAIDDCGDSMEGGTVLVPSGYVLTTASLWLKSNLTLRVESGATLLGSHLVGDAPIVYARRNALMTWAHAGFLNGGRCQKLKDPLVGWDDCAEWSKLENVVIEGGGTLDANGDFWYDKKNPPCDSNARPMMLDLMWIDGLTVRDMHIRRPGYWTIHPTFSNNVRVVGNDVLTYGSNTDGCDPDSTWNVYISQNRFSTGDDCIAIKAGRDWSGIMVNISTQNVLAERNYFLKGHGVSIGSETSGWIRNVTIRDSELDGTNLAVRLKTMRGRGGGIQDILYQNLTGKVISGLQLTLNYHDTQPTNWTATPELNGITIKDVHVKASDSSLECNGLSDSEIHGITFENVVVTGASKESCSYCKIKFDSQTSPKPKCHSEGEQAFVV